MMTNDVEKRWHDPAAFRAAVTYVVAVIVVAGVALAWPSRRSIDEAPTEEVTR